MEQQLNDTNLESAFRDWMAKQNSNTGECFSPKTIMNYKDALKNATTKLNLGNAVNSNLFFYTDLEKYEDACKIILAAPNFKEIDIAAHNRAYSCAMPLYFRFLKERNESIKETDLPEAHNEQKSEYSNYTKDDFLKDVYIDAKTYDTLRGLLNSKKNLILQGAPGVGKTFAAKRLAFSIMGEKDESRIKTVQFHQSYSYEDFVMGYRPDGNGFKLAEGPFYKFRKTAEDDDDRSYFFIIDEINRGNLSKIFGELLMLIEHDKRGEKNAIRLLYEDEQFSVPANVHIIGMMNTADRSLAMIDYALRRRFAFFEMEPAFQSEGFKAYQKNINNPKFDKLIKVVEELNNVIKEDQSLGAGFRIGHSYFCEKNKDTSDLSLIIEYELLPLLKEYWFDEPSKIEEWVIKLRNAIDG